MKIDRERETEDLARLLASFRARRLGYAAGGFFSVIVSAAAALFAVLVLFDPLLNRWRYAPPAMYLVFWGGVAAAAAAACSGGRGVFESKKALAERIGEKTGRGALFSSALEFTGDEERFAAYSPYLMGETVRRAVAELEGLPASGLFSDHGRPAWIAAGLLFTAIVLVQAAIGGESFTRVRRAVSDPRAAFAAGPGANLVSLCGDGTVVAGGDFTARAVRMGSARDEVRIRYSTVPGVWRSEVLEAEEPAAGPEPGEMYSRTFRDVREGFTCLFESGGEETGPCSIAVIHRPVINSVSARVEYPAYTKAEPETIGTLSGVIAALEGSRIDIFGETSRPVAGGTLIFSSGARAELEPERHGFRGSFIMSSDDTFRLSVVDSSGLASESTMRYPAVCLEDGPPSIEILSPGEESLLPRSLVAGLAYRAADDFGLVSIDLLYMKEGRDLGFTALSLGPKKGRPERDVEAAFEWSLESDRVFPGDRILYYLEARDGNPAPGAGYSRTKTRVLIVPSLSEIYAEARKEEDCRREDMEEMARESGVMRDRLRKLSEELRAEGEMDWKSRREGSEILEAQNELREKIRETADRLGDALEAMEQNRMTSMEIGRKMEQIQEMLGAIENTELRELMEKFGEMLNGIPESAMAAAMEQIEMSAQEVSDRLDRTIELLEKLIMEQRMEELVRRMEDMMERQSALKDSTASGDLESLSDEQEELGDEYGDFEDSAEEFARENADDAGETGEMMDKMKEALIDSLMRSAASQMEGRRRDEASSTQSETLGRMLSLYTQMGKCQMSMSSQSDQRAAKILEKAVKDLIDISIQYEKTMPRLAAAGAPGGPGALLGEYMVAREAARSVVAALAEAASFSMSVPQSALSRLAAALRMMDACARAVENRNLQAASMAAALVPGHINAAAMDLLSSISSPGGGSGGSMEQMRMMLQRQSSIDEQLRRMLGEGGEGSNSMEARAGMARMAAEQRKLQELMEQIASESRGAGGLLGRLDDIGEKMKEIAESLGRGELDERLLEREERILSRMLESQRSLERRDFKRDRVSRTAGEVGAREGTATGETGDEADILLEKIRRAMQDKGPAEYEELIRAYFRALSGKARGND
ncbi:MAG: hypothetical protein MUF59_00715 [Candidatus Krumholzibacteria bacterium]|nr:hypothetical protein [Candidatus Krumholzibacteria bacterium]